MDEAQQSQTRDNKSEVFYWLLQEEINFQNSGLIWLIFLILWSLLYWLLPTEKPYSSFNRLVPSSSTQRMN